MSSLIISSNEFTKNMKLVSEKLEMNTDTLNLEDLDKITNTIDNTINNHTTETNSNTNFKEIDKTKVSLCLNMIVRNESKIITRLLESVLPIIDTYVICDTGSTDNTPDIITSFFNKHNIQGEVINEPFKNFGYNRTFALKAAKGKATYALLLDADMIFKIEQTFDKQKLIHGAYMIIQKGGGLNYYNTRLIRLDINASCVGPTHEYYDLPQGTVNEKCDSIWINDIGDGGCKGDKFERDIRLLKQGIEEEPTNGRYYFYLANSYFNSGRHQESINYYKKRIELGGWVEEIFYSYLNLGHAHMKIGQDGEAIFAWMNGYNHHQTRSETIYEICKYYRERGKNKLAMVFCMLGKEIPYPKNDTLFIHKDVYETGFNYELSILGYYNNYPDTYKVINRLMNYTNQSYNNLLSNYKFYCPKLSSDTYMIKKIGDLDLKTNINVCGTEYEMYGSNPCIFKMKTFTENETPTYKYMVNIRFVNYKINENGNYNFTVNDGKIVTVNKIYELDDDLNIKQIRVCDIPTNNNLSYVGIEDIKPYCNLDNTNSNLSFNKYPIIPFLGTCQNPITHKLNIGYGEINMNENQDNDNDNNGNENNNQTNIIKTISYKSVNTPYNKDCEKNWVFYGDNNIIYQWYPLITGKISKNNNDNNNVFMFNKEKEISMPPFFQQVRGSSNGYTFNDEIWFICHVVEYCQPREYYHLFAIFDKNTMNIKKWSNLFKYEGEKIEYSLGLIVEEKRIIVSYSKWDSNPCIAIYDKEKVEKDLF